jgi:hypothetical protein
MRYLRFLAVFAAIVAVLIISVPAMAAPPPPAPVTAGAYYQAQGIEIFPGIDFAGNNYGATFVSQATGITNLPPPLTGLPYTGPLYNGSLSASINYQGTAPIPYGTNIFIGGSWTMTVSQNGKCIGTIVGKIPNKGGSVTWHNDANTGSGPNTGTEIGDVTTSLVIISASGVFQGLVGHTGKFVGQDNHVSGIFIAGIQVPTMAGFLTLN